VSLELHELTKVFTDSGDPARAVRAVDGLSLTVGEGELVTLLGPSGCGKTTALRMVAGFETPTAGAVWIDGTDVTARPPHLRDTAMVFQSYAIFPHLTVAENVGFGLSMRRLAPAEIARRVDALLELVQLAGLGARSPDRLSGGQQQRVALARAIITEPKVLLFDEPLSNLDAKLRAEMRGEIRAIQRRVGITSLYVTHDQAEAMALSDRIVVMRAGRVEQVGSPVDVYARPVTRFVADFVGRVNFLAAEPLGPRAIRVRLGDAIAELAVADGVGAEAGAWLVVLRPEAIRLVPGARAAPGLPLGRIRRTVYLGDMANYEVEIGAATLLVSVANPVAEGLFTEGDAVALVLPTEPVSLVPAS
jgi:iron(III) transport system ATP-binding protein